jgi:Xaa-Pro aminopeptidase
MSQINLTCHLHERNCWNSQEVKDLVTKHGGGNPRLAVDKIMMVGLRALKKQAFEVMGGEELAEKARVIKRPDEIKAMRCASHACETAVYKMETTAHNGVPKNNMIENDIWAVLHAENIKRGGGMDRNETSSFWTKGKPLVSRMQAKDSPE